MQGRKCIYLVEIDLAVLEMQKAEFGNFTVPVNNLLVCHMSSFVFLAADILLCAYPLAPARNPVNTEQKPGLRSLQHN